MASDDQGAARWLPAARTGSPEALGEILEACRGYLLLIAQRELASGFAVAYRHLGQALRARKDLAGAIAAYRTALAYEPRDVRAHFFSRRAPGCPSRHSLPSPRSPRIREKVMSPARRAWPQRQGPGKVRTLARSTRRRAPTGASRPWPGCGPIWSGGASSWRRRCLRSALGCWVRCGPGRPLSRWPPFVSPGDCRSSRLRSGKGGSGSGPPWRPCRS